MSPMLLALAWLAVAPAVRATGPAPAIVIRHVTVIDATGAPAKPDRDVVIRGGRIASVDSALVATPSRDAQVIDATGKFLIPGLWDMHGHLTDATEAAFPLLVMNGVTGMRDLGGDLARIDR